MYNLTFTANQAELSGGGVYWTDYEPAGLTTSCTFKNNIATFGADLVAPPAALGVNYTNEGGYEESGGTISRIVVDLLDEYGQLYADAATSATVFASTSTPGASVSGVTSTSMKNGRAVFEGLVASLAPNSTLSLTFTTSLLEGVTANTTVALRPCLHGEVQALGSAVCTVCPFGYFSWVPGEETCHACPEGAVCAGGDHIAAQWGYWRFNNTPGVCSTGDYDGCTLIECSSGEACEGIVEIVSSGDGGASLTEGSREVVFATQVSADSAAAVLKEYCFDADDESYTGCEFLTEGYYASLPSNASFSAVYDLLVDSRTLRLAASYDGSVGDLSYQSLYLVLPEQCGLGYEGNVCQRCSADYGKSSSGDMCVQCPDSLFLTYCIMIGGILLILLIGATLIKLQMDKDNSENEKLSIMTKIMSSYFQLASVFSTFSLEWPSVVLGLFEAQEMVSSASDAIIQIDCVFSHYQVTGNDMLAPVFFRKLLFFMLLPVLTVGLAYGFWLLVYKIKRRRLTRRPWDYEAAGLHDIVEDGMISLDEVKDTLEALGEQADSLRVRNLVVILGLERRPARVEAFQGAYIRAYKQLMLGNASLSIVILLFMYYVNISTYVLQVFMCTELSTGNWYLDQDLGTQCYRGIHLGWQYAIGVPGVIFYVVGIPAYGFYCLRQIRTELKEPHNKLQYGFLYDGYKAEYYWWEMWVMLRKTLVLVVAVFATRYGDLAEAVAGQAVVLVSAFAHLACAPYADRDLSALEANALYALVFTLTAGLFFYADGVDYGMRIFLLICILCANAALMTYFAKIGYAEVKLKIEKDWLNAQRKLKRIQDRLARRKNAEELSALADRERRTGLLDEALALQAESEEAVLLARAAAAHHAREALRHRDAARRNLEQLYQANRGILKNEEFKDLSLPARIRREFMSRHNSQKREKYFVRLEDALHEDAEKLTTEQAIFSLFNIVKTKQEDALEEASKKQENKNGLARARALLPAVKSLKGAAARRGRGRRRASASAWATPLPAAALGYRVGEAGDDDLSDNVSVQPWEPSPRNLLPSSDQRSPAAVTKSFFNEAKSEGVANGAITERRVPQLSEIYNNNNDDDDGRASESTMADTSPTPLLKKVAPHELTASASGGNTQPYFDNHNASRTKTEGAAQPAVEVSSTGREEKKEKTSTSITADQIPYHHDDSDDDEAFFGMGAPAHHDESEDEGGWDDSQISTAFVG